MHVIKLDTPRKSKRTASAKAAKDIAESYKTAAQRRRDERQRVREERGDYDHSDSESEGTSGYRSATRKRPDPNLTEEGDNASNSSDADVSAVSVPSAAPSEEQGPAVAAADVTGGSENQENNIMTDFEDINAADAPEIVSKLSSVKVE